MAQGKTLCLQPEVTSGNDGRHAAAFSGDRHWGNPVFAAQHGQSLAVACWLDNALILLRVHACSHVCTCAIRKNEWPACANERWREAVIETQGKIGDGNGCAVCSCNAQENKKHNSHTPLFPHHAAGQQALSRDAARGEAALFPSSRFMFVRSQNKTHFGDLLNEQCEDADPHLHQSAVCRDVNGPWLWMPLVPSASHHLRAATIEVIWWVAMLYLKKIFCFSCITTWKNKVSNIFSNILDMKNLGFAVASEKPIINRLYRLKTLYGIRTLKVKLFKKIFFDFFQFFKLRLIRMVISLLAYCLTTLSVNVFSMQSTFRPKRQCTFCCSAVIGPQLGFTRPLPYPDAALPAARSEVL